MAVDNDFSMTRDFGWVFNDFNSEFKGSDMVSLVLIWFMEFVKSGFAIEIMVNLWDDK